MDTPVTARTAILAALISGQAYGLEIVERVRARSRGVVSVHEGSLYPTLRALEHDGLLESFEAAPLPERGGRPRRYFKLTADGLRQAQELRRGLMALLQFRRKPT